MGEGKRSKKERKYVDGRGSGKKCSLPKAAAVGALIFVPYLVAGAMLPFWNYRTVSPETKKAFDAGAFRREGEGPDRAMLLETGTSAWEHRMRLMDRAKERIILSTFDMRYGESTKDILAVLWHKAEQGVKVQILVDGFSGFIRMEPEPLFAAAASHPNIEIRIYNPVSPLTLLTPWKSQGRMHDKYVIVDEDAYILGGRNCFDYFIGDYETDNKSLDREVLVWNTKAGSDPAQGNTADAEGRSSLYEVEDYFHKVWELPVCRPFHDDEGMQEKRRIQEQIAMLEERYRWLHEEHAEVFGDGYDYESHTRPTSCIRLVSNPVGIYGKEPTVFYTLTELMKQARERVILHTPYIVTNDYMNETLSDVADRVPYAEMVINSVENGDNFVASSDYQYHKKDIVDLGFQLYEYDGGISTHGKSFVIDHDLCGIGSYNWDLRSTYMDTELMLVVQSEELTADLTAAMDEIKYNCRQVVDEKNYIVPEHVTVARVPLWKRLAWKAVGFILQPFRCVA